MRRAVVRTVLADPLYKGLGVWTVLICVSPGRASETERLFVFVQFSGVRHIIFLYVNTYTDGRKGR